jgi:hypothetical protein
MQHRRSDPVEPNAFVDRPRDGERGARQLLRVQAVRAALRVVLDGRKRIREVGVDAALLEAVQVGQWPMLECGLIECKF